MDDGLLVLGVFGAWPTSLLLWHIRRVRDCGLCIEKLGSTEGWIPTVSLWWQHTPKQSLSDPHMEKSTDTKVAVCKFLDFIPRYVP